MDNTVHCRLLTRTVTYSLVFGIGYGLGLGVFFGLAAGIATGITLSIEFNRAARGLDHYSRPWQALVSAIRGLGFGAGLYRMLGFRHALAFALLITGGQVSGYFYGTRPAIDSVASCRPRLTRRPFWGTLVRTVGYIAAAFLWSAFIRHLDQPWLFAIRVGLVPGIVTAVGIAFNPYIEYYADNLPEPAWSLRRWTHALRLCAPVPAVLAGTVGCTPNLTSRCTQPPAHLSWADERLLCPETVNRH